MSDSSISRSMETPKIAELWQALRASGLEYLAPTLVQLRVRSLDDVTCRVTELSDAGVLQWQIEAIIAARGQEEHQRLETSAGRSDHPTPFAGRRASLAAALEAAQPNNRKRSLATLDADILAKSTTPSQESKVRTYSNTISEVIGFTIQIANVHAHLGFSRPYGFSRFSRFKFLLDL